MCYRLEIHCLFFFLNFFSFLIIIQSVKVIMSCILASQKKKKKKKNVRKGHRYNGSLFLHPAFLTAGWVRFLFQSELSVSLSLTLMRAQRVRVSEKVRIAQASAFNRWNQYTGCTRGSYLFKCGRVLSDCAACTDRTLVGALS